MRIETGRLVIDDLKAGDKEDYFCNISHDKAVLETFVCKYAETLEEFDFAPYLEKENLFAIRLKSSGSLIGIILYFDEKDGGCEIGYGLGSRYWNKGYATEAVKSFIGFCFYEKGFDIVYASFFPENAASKRVMEKCGFTYRRFSEKEFEYLGVGRDLIYYGINRPLRDGGLKLIKLTEEYKDQLTEMLYEWKADQEENRTDRSPWKIFKNDPADFRYYLENLEYKEPVGGFVPDSVFFLLDESRNRLVGAVNIRHYLNDALLRDGGHIGDGIRPSERRKGYGTKLVSLALEECRKLGIKKVLMVCDKSNPASAKTIIRNGGVLENEIVSPDGAIEQRYWITLD